MLTNKQLVDYVLGFVGSPYWYGTCGYKCSESLLKRKAAQYPEHYTENRMGGYRRDIGDGAVCFDCVGLIKSFFWSNGGQTNSDGSLSQIYESNGMPDTNANGLLKFCKNNGAEWGVIDDLPEVEGVALFSDGHVGVYVGGGQAVEARGFSYRVCQTRVSERKWSYWAYLPECVLSYDEGGESLMANKFGEVTLRKGSKGEHVKQLQSKLNELGFDCGSVDGDFGSKTEAAVKAFQIHSNLTADGVFGYKSFEALSSYYKGSNSEPFKALFESFLKEAQNLDSFKALKRTLGE